MHQRSIEQNKAVVIRIVEVLNSRNYDQLAELMTSDFVRHCQATPDLEINSLEDFKRFIQQDAAAFPDNRMEIEHLIAEGDRVAFYGSYRGTQHGPMGPFPPTGKMMEVKFSGVHRIKDGKIAETWITWDNLAALTQLGHGLPSQGETAEKEDATC